MSSPPPPQPASKLTAVFVSLVVPAKMRGHKTAHGSSFRLREAPLVSDIGEHDINRWSGARCVLRFDCFDPQAGLILLR